MLSPWPLCAHSPFLTQVTLTFLLLPTHAQQAPPLASVIIAGDLLPQISASFALYFLYVSLKYLLIKKAILHFLYKRAPSHCVLYPLTWLYFSS